MSFNPQALREKISHLPKGIRLCVALSGGLDSMALIHALVALREAADLPWALTAVHINHGINARALEWQQFCEQWCVGQQVPLSVRRISVAIDKAGLEERARNARYAAFAELLDDQDCLLLAHHLDDQMETLILRLLRGSGPGGLTGIPESRQVGKGRLVRPLLSFSRAELKAYAELAGLHWVEDGSNADEHFERNFCRHKLLPLIEQRWPDYRERLGRTQQLLLESDQLLQQLAQQDLALLRTEQATVIRLDALLEWDAPRQRNLLRNWLQQIGFPDISWNLLQRLTGELITARADSAGFIVWQGARLQRYHGQLFALQDLPEWSAPAIDWPVTAMPNLILSGNGSVEVRQGHGAQVLPSGLRLEVRYRRGGEQLRLPGRPLKSLKQLLQESAIEPWLRDRYPLIFVDGELAAIPDLGVNQDGPLAGAGSENPFHWCRPDLAYRS